MHANLARNLCTRHILVRWLHYRKGIITRYDISSYIATYHNFSGNPTQIHGGWIVKYSLQMQFQGKADTITAALRQMIITGEIEAGSSLRQRELADQFGVSPTPVREALRRLEAEGIVRHDLHRGVRALTPSETTHEDAFRIRASLESLAARMAAQRATDDDLDALRSLHADYIATTIDNAKQFELNRQFHFRIYEAAASPTLLALLQLLWQSLRDIPSIRHPSHHYRDEHAAILDAIIARNPEFAEDRMRRHILDQIKVSV